MTDLHLSRARIALQRPPAAERGVTREYLVHQAVADLFGDRDDRGYVWREFPGTASCADVLILSSVAPDETATARMPAHRRLASIRSKPFRPELTEGQRLDFEIRVNATRIVTTTVEEDIMSVGDGTRKTRQDIWDAVFAAGVSPETAMADVYAEWLRRKLEGSAVVHDVGVTERRMIWVRRASAAAPVPFVATNLVGGLLVADPEALVQRMADGIGRARAFGCGLLCL
ncbi:MAG: type I-E CRISPR-associated protein Cas6/Cse3/CasE, partial [Gemmatimonadaceae bacterium]|nr:type I-E CRISPR-associated protein Cas6/Cse3/CasE [Gemmatimonadaceae bacterium]